eukprot:s378_g15.t1
MERKRPAGSVLKSTGATVLSGPKTLAGDPRAPSAPALSAELTKSTGKLPEGRTRSSSRQLVDLGLKADDRHENKSSRAELNAKDLPGVPSALNEPLVEHRAERPAAVPAAAVVPAGSRKATADIETEDDLDALLKGLDAPSPVSAPRDPSLNLTRAETHAAVAKTSESCTSCGKAFEAGQNIYESSLTGEKQILCVLPKY